MQEPIINQLYHSAHIDTEGKEQKLNPQEANILPSFLVNKTKKETFLTLSMNNDTELPNGVIDYLHQRNNLLANEHGEKAQVKEWVSVLWILSDFTKDKSESFYYAKMAYEQSASLPTNYIHGSICRLAIKVYENNEEDQKNIFKELVHEALEISSKSKDITASLCSCATALYWIYKKTGELGSLAEDYCLKASLFSTEHEGLLVEIQEKLYDLSDLEVFQMIARRNLLLGLKERIKPKYIELLKNRIIQKNIPYTGNQQVVKELLEELSLWQEKSINEDFLKVELFIMEQVQWEEKSLLKLVHSHQDLYTLNRLLDVYHLSGKDLPPNIKFQLYYLYVKLQTQPIRVLFSDNTSFEMGYDQTDTRNLPYASHFLASHYIASKDTFMAMVILLEFKKLALKLVEETFRYKNNPVVRGNWYFFCIRALERVVELYPQHELVQEWKDELKKLWASKREIDSTLPFNWEEMEMEEETEIEEETENEEKAEVEKEEVKWGED